MGKFKCFQSFPFRNAPVYKKEDSFQLYRYLARKTHREIAQHSCQGKLRTRDLEMFRPKPAKHHFKLEEWR